MTFQGGEFFIAVFHKKRQFVLKAGGLLGSFCLKVRLRSRFGLRLRFGFGLFDGKGKLSDIYLITCYSLVPMILIELVITMISNFVLTEEVVLLNAVSGIGIAWFCFLMVAGLCVIHEYSLLRNLATLVVTLIAAAILVFLFVLFLTLMEQMIGFFITFIQEWIRRM